MGGLENSIPHVAVSAAIFSPLFSYFLIAYIYTFFSLPLSSGHSFFSCFLLFCFILFCFVIIVIIRVFFLVFVSFYPTKRQGMKEREREAERRERGTEGRREGRMESKEDGRKERRREGKKEGGRDGG